MFDDQQPKQPSPPGNLPAEPADMFAGLEGDSGTQQGQAPATPAAAGPASPAAPAGDDTAPIFSAGPAQTATPPAAPAFPSPPGSAPAAATPPAAPAGGSDALSAGLLKKKEPPLADPAAAASMPNLDQTPAYNMKKPILGRILMIVLIIIVLLSLGLGAWWLFSRSSSSPADTLPITPAIDNPVNEEFSVDPAASGVIDDSSSGLAPVEGPAGSTDDSTTTATDTVQNVEDEILFGEATVDTDGDGLDDIRERNLDTNPNNGDSDNDGLSDYDEVVIWKTDPLNPDTDSDTYPDGTEVRNNYNPRGPGRLFDIPGTTPTGTDVTTEAGTDTTTTGSGVDTPPTTTDNTDNTGNN